MNIKSFLKVFSLINIVFFSLQNAQAEYKWPVIDSVDIRYNSNSSATYKLHIAYVTIPLSSELDQVPAACTADKCYLSVVHRHRLSSGYNTTQKDTLPSEFNFSRKDTWSTILEKTTKYSLPGTIDITHLGNNGGECVDLALIQYGAVNSGDSWSAWEANAERPPSEASRGCFGLPPVNEWCALTTPKLTLDFGILRMKDAVGATSQTTANVSCTAGMKYTLKLKGLSKIYLSNGMTAEFTANNKKLGETLDGIKGESNPVKLEATLTGTPPKDGGDFSGASVLSVSYP